LIQEGAENLFSSDWMKQKCPRPAVPAGLSVVKPPCRESRHAVGGR